MDKRSDVQIVITVPMGVQRYLHGASSFFGRRLKILEIDFQLSRRLMILCDGKTKPWHSPKLARTIRSTQATTMAWEKKTFRERVPVELSRCGSPSR